MEEFKKVFGIDLDGTLLNRYKKIPKKSLQSLKKYYDNGGNIAIITGKCITSGKKYINQIENAINGKLQYASFLSGSIVFDLQKNEIIDKRYLSSTQTAEIFKIIEEHHAQFFAVQEIDNQEFYYVSQSPIFFKILKPTFIRKKPYMIMKDYVPFECFKINICNYGKKPSDMQTIIQAINQNPQFHVSQIKKHFIEVTACDANKSFALKKICNLSQVDITSSAAIGDSCNDIPMLATADLSFGIGKEADTSFQNVADIKIKRSKKNPVAFAINNYLLTNK